MSDSTSERSSGNAVRFCLHGAFIIYELLKLMKSLATERGQPWIWVFIFKLAIYDVECWKQLNDLNCASDRFHEAPSPGDFFLNIWLIIIASIIAKTFLVVTFRQKLWIPNIELINAWTISSDSFASIFKIIWKASALVDWLLFLRHKNIFDKFIAARDNFAVDIFNYVEIKLASWNLFSVHK